MGIESGLAFVQEFLFVIATFGLLVAYAMVRGRAALISLILALYAALILSLKFPYYDWLFEQISIGQNGSTVVHIALFAFFVALSTVLFERLIASDGEESRWSGFGKKLIIAILGTLLILAYSYHVLPASGILEPSQTVTEFIAPTERFFWFLLIPLIGLFFV